MKAQKQRQSRKSSGFSRIEQPSGKIKKRKTRYMDKINLNRNA